MTETEPQPFLVREEAIARLERIVIALTEAVKQSGLAPATGRSALGTAISCRCTRCGVVVDGKYLLELARLPAKSEAEGIKRLRQGLCAREQCDSTFYELILQKHPDLNWPDLLAPPKSERKVKREIEKAAAVAIATKAAHRRMIRIALLIAAGLLLLILRQYYLGGRIPLVRTPEKFRVDPAPPEGMRER